MRKIRWVAPILVLMFVACATIGVNLDTPEKKYLSARSELNLLLEEYISVQDLISDADHQIAKDAFVMADKALDSWRSMLGYENYDFSKDIRTWLQAKKIILEVLRRAT